MQQRSRRRAARWSVAAALVATLAGCGDAPLESVGQRSSEWIGPVADGVRFLSNDSAAEGPAVDDPAVDDPVASPVSVSEGDG
jgi:hypothetical protein